MSAIRFAKTQGVGNDFVVVAAGDMQGLAPEELAVRLCAHHFAVGSDGLLIIGPPSDHTAAFSFHMHNPDGSADMCGNGLRCAALYALRVGLVAPSADSFLIETKDGLLRANFVDTLPDQTGATVTVQMPVPRFKPAEIPFTGYAPSELIVDYPLPTPSGDLVVTSVNTGSAHSVSFVDALPDDSRFNTLSPAVENHPYFPERTSLMWTESLGNAEFAVRIWERAVGETFGCGTGACAVAVAAILTGRARHSDTIRVRSKGGTLSIEWPSRDSAVWMTGPAQWIYEGAFPLEI